MVYTDMLWQCKQAGLLLLLCMCTPWSALKGGMVASIVLLQLFPQRA
jgi:hypothetical protein